MQLIGDARYFCALTADEKSRVEQILVDLAFEDGEEEEKKQLATCSSEETTHAESTDRETSVPAVKDMAIRLGYLPFEEDFRSLLDIDRYFKQAFYLIIVDGKIENSAP